VTNAISSPVKFFAGEERRARLTSMGNYDRYQLEPRCERRGVQHLQGGKFDVAAMSKKAEEIGKKQGKVVLLLNFPNNPTGYSPSTAEMTAIADAIVKIADTIKKPVVVIGRRRYDGVCVRRGRGEAQSVRRSSSTSTDVIPVKMDGASKELLFYGGRVAL